MLSTPHVDTRFAPAEAVADGPARRLTALLAGFVLAAAAAMAQPPAAGPGPAPADLLFLDGAVYTVDAARSWAEAVGVRDGRIVYVGTSAGAAAWRGPQTRVVELAGRMLLPGFHDSHLHPVSSGMELGQCDLYGLKTREAVFAAIARYAAERPDDDWLLGSGWELPVFPEANPTRQELDRLVPDRPAYIPAADGHSAWVNSKALALAGVTRETPDPPNGRIERDAAGEPSGTLREAAKALVSKLVPPPTPAQYREGLGRALALAARFGITTLVEANADLPTLEAYAALDASGELSARVLASQSVDVARGPEQIEELVRRRALFAGNRLRASAAKVFVDGVIESETAALLAPYLERPGWSGEPNLSAEALDRLAAALDAAGFQIHVHAIGDRAIRITLDALEAARQANGVRDARPLLAHIQLFDPADIPRFRRLGAVAVFQPLWAYEDSYIRELTLPKLGPERSRWIYPIASLAASGAALAAGSDWNVSSLDPLEAIQVAVTRRDPEQPAAEVFIPEERVDLPTMLAAYTVGGAWAAFQEQETGSIEVGKAADLIVLDQNLFELPSEQIRSAKVLLTLLEGREVYRDPAFTSPPATPPVP